MDPRYADSSEDEAGARRVAYGWVAIANLVTLVGVYYFHDRANLLDALAARGRYASGVVTDVSSPARVGRATASSLVYRFEVGGGVYTGRTYVKREQARRARRGDFVDVIYLPSSPGRHVAKPLAAARQDFKVGSYWLYAVVVSVWGSALWKLVRAPAAGVTPASRAGRRFPGWAT